jgi:hypothetical protein
LYYTVLKILGLTRQQWDALPWHDQRMYVEQLNQDPEFHGEDDDGGSSGGAVELTSWDDLPPGV